MHKKFIKSVSYVSLFLFIFSLLYSFVLPVSATTTSLYSDVTPEHWAYKHVAKMKFRNVVSGYTDGTFKPDNAVTQLEAVLMAVRNMEADDQLASININRSLPFVVPDWAEKNAKRELLFAIDKGLIEASENDFDASKLASRAWITRLMVRMIGKDSEALSNTNQNSNFNDASTFPSWAKGYINTAVKYDLISGFPDGSFKPAQIVTRAQTASLLGRAETHLNLNSILQGKIISISGGILSIITNNQVEKVNLSSNTLVLGNNGQVCDWIDLNINDIVYVIRDASIAKYIEVLEEDVSNQVLNGTVLHVIPEERVVVFKDSDNNLYTKTLDVNAICTNQNGDIYDLSQITAGTLIEVHLNSDGLIATIVLTDSSANLNTNGIIYDIEPSQKLIVIKNIMGSFISFIYDDNTKVTIEEQRFASIDDLQIGDKIAVKSEGSVITEIKLIQAQQELSVSGKVVLNSPENQLLIIETNDGNVKTYPVSNNIEINIPGISIATLSDIMADDQVNLLVENGEIVQIDITSKNITSTHHGEIVAVDTDSNILIIKDGNDNLETYEVSDAAEIIIDDDSSDLADLSKGMKVEFEIVADKIIYIEDKNSLEGTVISINADRRLISISPADGSTSQTFIIARDTDVDIEDFNSPDVDDISRGDYVELEIQDEVVTNINVKRTYNYEITYVYDSSEKLKVIDEDDDTKYLYLSDNVEISIPGKTSPDIDDFNKGDLIKATYIGNKLLSITVIPEILGQITSINSSADTFVLKDFNGNLTTYNFDSDSQVVDQNQTFYTLNSLMIGDRVKIKENADGSLSVYLLQKISARYVTIDSNQTKLYIYNNSSYETYKLAQNYYLHSGNQTISFRTLTENDYIDIYILDDEVYEIEKL